MELKKASEGDEEILAEMWYTLAKEMEQYSKFNEIKYEDAEKAEKDFREQIKGKEKTDYLIKDEGLTKGYLTLKQGSHPSREHSKYTKIINLFIKKDHRNEGLGTQAIQKTKEIAAEKGSDHLKVTSEIKNTKAVKFYTKKRLQQKTNHTSPRNRRRIRIYGEK